jgi:Holliday junction resolvase
MGGKAARDRGQRGERMLRDIFNYHGYNTRRGDCFRHEQDVEGLPYIHVECKFTEKLRLREAMDQAIEESAKKDGGLPTVFHKTNRQPWLVTMRIDDWMKLYKTWEEAQRHGRAEDVREDDNRQ